MTTKGFKDPCATVRVYRKKVASWPSGSKLRQQLVREEEDEEYIYIPARYAPGGQLVRKEVRRMRPVYRLINHRQLR